MVEKTAILGSKSNNENSRKSNITLDSNSELFGFAHIERERKRERDLVAFPADAGESIDHTLDVVELANQVRRVWFNGR